MVITTLKGNIVKCHCGIISIIIIIARWLMMDGEAIDGEATSGCRAMQGIIMMLQYSIIVIIVIVRRLMM